MKTVVNNINELIINKSRFITCIYYVDNTYKVNIILKDIKKIYPNANHYCYAYIINDKSKVSDDGEPTGTAGIPILNVLKKENINYVLCIVIRYFGGVKLGTGGLIRAYSKACKNALKIINLKKGFEVKIVFNYDELKKIDYLLKNCEIITKSFKEIITYTFKATEDEYNIINSNLKDKTLSIKHIYF